MHSTSTSGEVISCILACTPDKHFYHLLNSHSRSISPPLASNIPSPFIANAIITAARSGATSTVRGHNAVSPLRSPNAVLAYLITTYLITCFTDEELPFGPHQALQLRERLATGVVVGLLTDPGNG